MSKKKKIIIIVLASIVLLFALAFIGGSYYIGTQVFENSSQLVTCEDTSTIKDSFWEKMNMDPDKFRSEYEFENIKIDSSFDRHIIPGDYISAGDAHDKVVIMIHGLGGNRYTNYPVAAFFLENGYDVITYDQRSSNENTAQYTTFGYWEKYDVADLMDYVTGRYPDISIGLWGTSFGGTTAVQAAANAKDQSAIKFMILDCPLGDVEYMISAELNKMNLGIPTEYMIWCSDIINKNELGFSYEDANSIKIARNVTVPTLVINSKVDETTPYYMGKFIYDNINTSDKKIWTVSDSKHASIWEDHNEQYRKEMSDFIAER